jgi:methylated-DNA-[protein]-cysteine S-methyltransferase
LNRKIIEETPFGPVCILWSGPASMPRVTRVLISTPLEPADERAASIYPDAQAASCRGIDALARGIQWLLAGEAVEFSLAMLDLRVCTPFQRAVLQAEHQIPRGAVSSYQHIAAYLGKKGGARAVGGALANNPFPLLVPCHRAIRSDRRIGGFQGGAQMKRKLLADEGVAFDEKGRVQLTAFYYEDCRHGNA